MNKVKRNFLNYFNGETIVQNDNETSEQFHIRYLEHQLEYDHYVYPDLPEKKDKIITKFFLEL